MSFNAFKTVALFLALLFPFALVAQDAPKKELSEKVSEAIQGIGKMLDEKNYDGVLNTVNGLLAQAKPESFDTAYLSQIKVQALVAKQDYAGCIGPLETAIRLSERHKFFEKRAELELLWTLAQLYVQDASLEKNQDIQKQKYTLALTTVRRWLAQTTKPNFEAYYFAATILYQQAIGAGKDPDKNLLKQAETECKNALLMAIKPREQIYQLLVAIKQALNENDAAAKYLELILEANPKSSQYWNMLLATYINIADAMPEGSFIRNESYVRAVYTIQRAQALGFMKTPTDYFRMVAMYVNSSQFEGAVDILEPGLRDGRVENDAKNWELLAQAYMQLNDHSNAIRTYKDASALFPQTGEFDMKVGNLYYSMERYQPALDNMLAAAKKGVPQKSEAPLYFFIGYLQLELKQLDEALVSINKSVELNPSNAQAKDLRKVIEDSIKERDSLLMKNAPATKAQPKSNQQTSPAQSTTKA